jgi:hypothetical protein
MTAKMTSMMQDTPPTCDGQQADDAVALGRREAQPVLDETTTPTIRKCERLEPLETRR